MLLQDLNPDLPITTIENNIPNSQFGKFIAVGDYNGGGKPDLAIDYFLPLPNNQYDAHLTLITGESLMAGATANKEIVVNCGTNGNAANIACLSFGTESYISAYRTMGTLKHNVSPQDQLIVPLVKITDKTLQLHAVKPKWQSGTVGFVDWQNSFTCLSDDVPFTGSTLISGHDFNGDNVDDLFVAGRDSQAYLLLTE
jgi:hypothetical protein